VRIWLAWLVVAAGGCGPAFQSPTHGHGGGDLGVADLGAGEDLAPGAVDQLACQLPSTPAGAEVELAAPFAPHYKAYALGKVPGVPNPLGGVIVKAGDPSTLLVAGESERATGALYAITVQRDPCNHIIGFVGSATKVADTPYVDANLVYGPQSLLLYTGWPQFELAQLPAGATVAARTTDLRTVGMDATGDSGAGGHGFVPPAVVAAAGQLRVVTWPAGRWYHVAATVNAGLFDISALSLAATLPNNPGGFAYVPAGSPGFAKQSIIVAEWSQSDRTQDRVAVYEADGNGDPVVATRQEFMTKFPRPWGAYFEPVTGDYLFLTWGDGDDRVYIVQGFAPPPPIF
jgi:hypothetical protein